jgi:polysaccharide export outer membrane protein
MMAGGFATTAKSSRVAVMRRAPNGGMMMRTVNIGRGMRNMGQYNDVLQLRRGDIVFVPRTRLAEVAIWMQTFRDALPVDFNLSYQVGANNGATTVISP